MVNASSWTEYDADINGDTYTLIAGAQWTLGPTKTIEYLNDLQAILAANLDTDVAQLVVEPITDREYRVDTGFTETADEFKMNLLDNVALTPIDSTGRVMTHSTGMSPTEIETELAAVEDWCLARNIGKPKVMIWPQHRHDREMKRLIYARDGYVGGRNGVPNRDNYQATSSDAHGHFNNAIWLRSWDYLTPQELILQNNYQASVDIDGAADTYAAQAAVLDNAARVPTWKANNTLLSVYWHDLNDVSVSKIGHVLDYFQNDSDIWVTNLRDALIYARARHTPGYKEFVEIPKPGHTAADYGGKPWNGKSMAVCFSMDDGRDHAVNGGVNDFAPLFAARGLTLSCGLVYNNIDTANHMTSADLVALEAAGTIHCENHGKTHGKFLQDGAFRLKNPSGGQLAVRIYDNAGTQTLEIWRAPSIAGATVKIN